MDNIHFICITAMGMFTYKKNKKKKWFKKQDTPLLSALI